MHNQPHEPSAAIVHAGARRRVAPAAPWMKLLAVRTTDRFRRVAAETCATGSRSIRLPDVGLKRVEIMQRVGIALVLCIGCYTGLPDGQRDVTAGIGSVGDDTLDPVTASAASETAGGSDSTSEDDGGLDPSTDDESSTGDPIDDPNAPREAAIDIAPTGLHVNQGIAVTLADAGTVLPGGTRTAKTVHGRRTLVFGTWTTTPAFVPRTIRAELHLAHVDGITETLVSETFVNGPSGAGESDAHFTWTIEPEQFPAGARWSVTLHELEPTSDGLPAPAAPRLPVSGDSELDDEDGNQRIRIVFIPYRHVFNGCERLAPSDAAILDGHRRAMEQQYPTQQVEITLHAEVSFGASMATGDAVLTNVVELRAAEAPAPDVYYYGFLWPCDPSTNYGGLGYVPYAPTTLEEAPWRAAVGIWYDFAPDFTYQTMVHEVGHNHGRNHVACAGTEGQTDPAYPIPGGATGVLGWGIHDGVFHPASNTDYMTYCENQWVSQYAWNHTLSVIDALTGAVGGAPPPSEAEPPEAIALAVRDGEVTAATRIAGVTPRRAESIARWTMRDGSIAWTAVQRDLVPDSDAEFFTVGMPSAPLDDVEAFELDATAGAVVVPRAAIATRRFGRR
jgi:hypothetical protein